MKSAAKGNGLADSRPILAFDLMDTVVVDPFYTEIPRLFARPLEEIHPHRDRSAWPAFECNEIDEATFLRRFYRDPAPVGLPSAQEVRQVIHDGYRFVQGMPELLQRLRAAGLVLWLFSNYPVWFELIRQRYALERFFSGFVVSYQTGARKPEAAAYDAFCGRVGRAPEQCLLIDDRAVNVEGARAAGMQALQFEGVEQLERDLVARDLI